MGSTVLLLFIYLFFLEGGHLSIDDVVIARKNEKELEEHLQRLFQILSHFGLKIKSRQGYLFENQNFNFSGQENGKTS